MLIKIARPWEIPEREATPEHVYWNRRSFLKAAGITAFGLIAGCSPAGEKGKPVPAVAQKDPTLELYPAKRNEKYVLDRPLTKEAVAAEYNNYYEFTENKNVFRYMEGFQLRPWTVEIAGLVKQPKTYDIDSLIRQMTLEERVYRHRCVEAWAMAVPWTGFALADLVRSAEPLASAKYLRMISFYKEKSARNFALSPWYPWPYFEGITLQEAMNELAFLVTGIYGHPLPVQHGAPLRLALPWKYGYKSIKGIVRIEFTDQKPPTFWNKIAPDEYDFWSNVNPEIPHPRWSQASERMLGTDERRPTMHFNGYQSFVNHLYV